MYTEDYKHNGLFIRKLLLKIILIVAIVALLIWLVPKIISYKPSNKVKNNNNDIKITERNTNKTDFSKNLQTLKEAALMYYKENKLPSATGDIEIVTLKQLVDEKLVTNLYNNTKKCDVKKSNVKITKLENDYLLKTTIVCDGKTDYTLVHVGKYEYCTNTICEKEEEKNTEKKEEKPEENAKKDVKEKQEESHQEERIVMNEEKEQEQLPEKSQNTQTANTTITNTTNKESILTAFSDWSNYTKTPCTTKNVTCAPNDKNCLKETRVKKEREPSKTEVKIYSTISLGLRYDNTWLTPACPNYNYINIQGTTYKTPGNYEEITYLANKTSTDSWKYIETISTRTTPNFGGNKYYKFIGADFSSCTDTCPNGPAYYYDVYQYTKSLIRTTNVTEGCTNPVYKKINSYTIVKFTETVARQEIIYQDVCYESSRTRKVIK